MDVPAEIINKYTCGWCMWLALALHDRYGWDLYAQVDRLAGSEHIAHAFVKRPDGKEIDILGVQDRVDIYSSNERQVTRDEFIRLIGGKHSDTIEEECAPDKEEADMVIDAWLIPGIFSE